MDPPIDSKNKAAAPEVVMSVKGKMEAKWMLDIVFNKI